jgi:hypothetical protein
MNQNQRADVDHKTNLYVGGFVGGLTPEDKARILSGEKIADMLELIAAQFDRVTAVHLVRAIVEQLRREAPNQAALALADRFMALGRGAR